MNLTNKINLQKPELKREIVKNIYPENSLWTRKTNINLNK